MGARLLMFGQITRKATGLHYERQAQKYLRQQGLILMTRNYQCKVGEIDLIMKEDDTLVFVEVRYRRSNQYGGALASVNHSKQRKLRLTAQYYLSQSKRNLHQQLCRFDVVAFEGQDIHWIRSAF